MFGYLHRTVRDTVDVEGEMEIEVNLADPAQARIFQKLGTGSVFASQVSEWVFKS